MSRPRPADLGVVLPPLVTTSVGSLPAPAGLLEARRRALYDPVAAGTIEAVARHATEHWIDVQERLGIDVLVDGQLTQGDMLGTLTAGLAGFAPAGLVRAYGNHYYRKWAVVGPVEWRGPIMLDGWRFAQSLTSRPVKAIVTGPYTLMHWSFVEHYPNRASACLAIAAAIRHEIEALVGAGTKIVQVDEPALGVRPGEWALAVGALHVLSDDLPAYVVAHTCNGAFAASTSAQLDLPVDNLDVIPIGVPGELPSRVDTRPHDMDLTLGIVPAQGPDVPREEEIAQRIRSVVQGRDPAALWISPDCGLRTRSAAEAETILTRMVQATREVRAGLPQPVPSTAPPSPLDA